MAPLRRSVRASRAAAGLRLVALLVAVLAALLVPACKGKKAAPEPTAAQPAPPPAGLLADVYLTTPDVTWQRVRGKMGGPAALLPVSFPSLVVTLLGLPPQIAEQVDGNLVAYGAVVEIAPGGAADLVLAVHLRDQGRVLEVLTAGQDARYQTRKDTSGVTMIEPKAKTADAFAAMAIANNYLLASKTPEALMIAGPYVTRTLPTLPKPSAEITVSAGHAALAGPIAARIRAEWAGWKKAREKDDEALRQQHGRAPDFGDPAAALADIDGKVRRLNEVMSDLSQARLEVNTDEAGAHARIAMVPQGGGGVATREIGALVVGDTAPLLEMPASSVMAMLSRDTEEVRKGSAQEQAEGLGHVLGERIAAEDKKKVADVLDSWARARGDWLAAGVEWTTDSRALIVRAPLKDQALLDKAIEGTLELPSVGGLKEPIERFAGKLAFSKPSTDGGVKIVRVQRESADATSGKKEAAKVKRRKGADEFEVAWQADPASSMLRIVATGDAKAWLAAESRAKPATLADDAEVANLVKALGSEAAFVFMFQPFKILSGMTSRNSPAKPASIPVIFSYGRARGEGWFRLDLPYAALTELVRGVMSR